MNKSMKKLKEVKRTMGAVGKMHPEAMQGFQNFMKGSKSDGALNAKTKELIGVAISIARQCSWCITLHIKNALDAGATREEIIEASLVAVTLGGGPALMHMHYVFEALDDLENDQKK